MGWRIDVIKNDIKNASIWDKIGFVVVAILFGMLIFI